MTCPECQPAVAPDNPQPASCLLLEVLLRIRERLVQADVRDAEHLAGPLHVDVLVDGVRDAGDRPHHCMGDLRDALGRVERADGPLVRPLEVDHLEAMTNYRQDRLAGRPVWFTPLDRSANRALNEIWRDLTGGREEELVLEVKGREIHLPRYWAGMARCTFWELCGQPLGPADYLAVAEAVRVLILEDVPRLSSENYNEARRFVTLIDALYEARTRLIVSAADRPENLYIEGEGSFEFGRTASRLREMQSADWPG